MGHYGQIQAIFLGAVLFGVPAVTRAAGQPPVSGPAAVAEVNAQKLHAAFDHLYNLEFDAARVLFSQVVAAEPDSATARAFLASALLYEILARQGTLQSQLFVTTNEFLRQRRLPPEPDLRQRFQHIAEEALDLGRHRIERNSQDTDGLFALGLTYGDLANFAAGVEGRYFAGLRLGEKSYEYHEKLHQLHPEIHDTNVVLGVHDYVIGSLPRFQRFLLFVVGSSGDRERGLGYLGVAAEHGEYLRSYARVLLAVASIREGKKEQAAQLLESLRGDYPRNPLFLSELARLYREQRRYAQAAQICRELLAELTAHPHNPRLVGPEDAWLELGRVQAEAGETDTALQSFEEAGHVGGASQRIVAWAHLERGRLFDQRGDRQQALSEYEKVIRLAANEEASNLAVTYRKTPYRLGSDSHH